jgi:putative transposase
MARPLRVEFSGALYHVTARGNERKAIYRDDRDRQRFLDRLAAVVSRHRLVLHAYVLMRNHFHLLIETPEANLARAMGELNGAYTQDFNRRHHRSGPLFQGRYKAILVEKDSYLLELSRYIHLNPVRVGEVRRAGAFAWSSAVAYLGKAAAPPWLSVTEVLGHFGRRLGTARRGYAKFLAAGGQRGGAAPWDKVEGQLLLGDPRWVKRMKRRVTGRAVGAEVGGAHALRRRPSLSVVVTQVCRAAGVDQKAMLRRHGLRGGWARAVAMALAWEVCGMGQTEIGQAFGVGPHAVSKAIVRAKTLAATSGRTGNLIRLLTSSFKG